MRVSSSVEYAARVAVVLAGLGPGMTLSAERIAAAENIPRDYVDQLLQRLRRAGIVTSRRGALGGYCLARPAAEVSVGMIVRAVENGVFEQVCERYAEGEHACSHTSGCGIRPVWRKLAELVEAYLDRVTIDQLASESDCAQSRVELLFAQAGKRRD